MAGGTRLSGHAGKQLLGLLAFVLLLHLLALQWLARQLEQPALLRPMATPMFTRLLRPQAPPAAPAPPAVQAVRTRPRPATITSVAGARAKPGAAAASAPAAAASASPAGAAQADAAPQSPVAPDRTEASSAPDAAATTASAPAMPASDNSAPLDGWPADTRLNYRLGGHFRGELHGSARVQWQRQDNRYQTRVDIDVTLLASLVLTSQGEVTPQGLLPRAYEELRRSGPRGLRLGDETITLGNGTSVPRPAGVQDTASQFVELSHRFAAGQDVLEVGRSVSFWMARPGGVDLWTYDIVGLETLQTPQLGAVEAFHLKPRPIANPHGNITAEMWFAPSLQYLPVRIRVNMGETTYVDLIVDEIEQR